MRISKVEMAHRIGISIATLDRRVKRGELTPVYGPEKNNFGKLLVWFLVDDPEPSVSIVDTHPYTTDSIAPDSEPCTNLEQRPPSNIDAKLEEDFSFAHRFLEGQVTDSFGNRIDGTNATYHTQVTLLGPEPRIERRPSPTSTGHMNPALLPNLNVPSAGDLSHPLNKGFKGIEVPRPPRHPNANRQEFLNVILRDIRYGGFSR